MCCQFWNTTLNFVAYHWNKPKQNKHTLNTPCQFISSGFGCGIVHSNSMAPMAICQAESIRAQDPDFSSYSESSHRKGSMMGEVGYRFKIFKLQIQLREILLNKNRIRTYQKSPQVNSWGQTPFRSSIDYRFAGGGVLLAISWTYVTRT